jgi:flagellar FliL protein
MRPGRIILIAIILLLLGGLGGAGYFFRQPIKRMLGLSGAETAAEAPPPKKTVRPEDVVFIDLPDIMVTLEGKGGSGHIVKLAASLQLDDKDDLPRVNAYVPRIVDVFQVYIRQLGVADVGDTAKLQHVRDELLPRLNTALAPAHVDDVLFREVMVQ